MMLAVVTLTFKIVQCIFLKAIEYLYVLMYI